MRPPLHRPLGWRPPELLKREADRARPTAADRGYGTDWRKLRAAMPRAPCAMCGRPWAPSFHLDHRTARAQGGTDHPSNLQWLCQSDHAAKTARADGGFGNARR
jgi:5-methylcytosine-specific restriction protein A